MFSRCENIAEENAVRGGGDGARRNWQAAREKPRTNSCEEGCKVWEVGSGSESSCEKLCNMLYRSVASQSCLDVTSWKQTIGPVAKLAVILKQIS